MSVFFFFRETLIYDQVNWQRIDLGPLLEIITYLMPDRSSCVLCFSSQYMSQGWTSDSHQHNRCQSQNITKNCWKVFFSSSPFPSFFFFLHIFFLSIYLYVCLSGCIYVSQVSFCLYPHHTPCGAWITDKEWHSFRTHRAKMEETGTKTHRYFWELTLNP